MSISHADRVLTTTFLPPPLPTPIKLTRKNAAVSLTCSLNPKHARCPKLDVHVSRSNQIRFITKLKTLLLSKPKHFLPLRILSKCRSYLSISHHPRSLISLIHRYPSLFQLFTIPTPPRSATPFSHQLCVRLTPAAHSLALRESKLHSDMSVLLAVKLQKLLMLSSHRRLLLSKLVHIAPDFGLPPNFRSRLCNDFPHLFKTVDTSYGRALQLVSWNADVAKLYQCSISGNNREREKELIVERPLKFKRVRLRKGLNVKRRHHEFLVKFGEVEDVCPYNTSVEEVEKESLEGEKRACAVVREVLGMCVEKRTLIDHLTHFRKELGLPNKLRGMIVRHPELFYVSCKGLRDSVFLVEAFDDKGNLLEKDESLVIKDQLLELVREAKRMRRDRRKRAMENGVGEAGESSIDVGDDGFDGIDDYDDGLENLFESEDSSSDFEFDHEIDESSDFDVVGENYEFWTANASTTPTSDENGSKAPW